MIITILNIGHDELEQSQLINLFKSYKKVFCLIISIKTWFITGHSRPSHPIKILQFLLFLLGHTRYVNSYTIEIFALSASLYPVCKSNYIQIKFNQLSTHTGINPTRLEIKVSNLDSANLVQIIVSYTGRVNS